MARGKSLKTNWKRPADTDMIVIPLELDVSSDPRTQRRVEAQWSATYTLRRAIQRDARNACDAFEHAHEQRAREGWVPAQQRYPLSRKALEERGKHHVEEAKWLRDHVTKASALHVADEVATTVSRFLKPDVAGNRAGKPQVGGWWDYTRIPGRARSHTKDTPTWETYRLVGSPQGHLDQYRAPTLDPSIRTVSDVLGLEPGSRVLDQPAQLPLPQAPVKRGRTDWWRYSGALTVVYTGLPGGDVILPVRLPQGAGRWPRLAHFLADSEAWHKIDLVRVRDHVAPGGWRYYAHLHVLTNGYTSPDTQARRAGVPTGRRAGVDGNVSSLEVVSTPLDGDGEEVLAHHVRVTTQMREQADWEALHARREQRALDRSRRATNPSEYELSKQQKRELEKRKKRGKTLPKGVIPKGARFTKGLKSRVPQTPYRVDELSNGYRHTRAKHADMQRHNSQAKHARAHAIATLLVAEHGAEWVTEHVNMRSWAKLWGRGIRLFSPGMLLAALKMEAVACGGSVERVGTRQTALSQHCLCSARVPKTLADRVHECPECGLVWDRDLASAALALCTFLKTPGKPSTAYVDYDLAAEVLERLVAQHVASVRSTTTSADPVSAEVVASHFRV